LPYESPKRERIILAREFRKMTQARLAEQIGENQYLVSRIEGGSKTIEPELVEKIAKATHLPPKFFYGSFSHETVPVTLFRKRKLNQTDAKSIKAQLTILVAVIDALLRAVEDRPVRLNQIDIEEYGDSFEDAARDLRLQWRLPPGPVDDVTALVEKAGVLVVRTRFVCEQVDGVSIWEDGLPPIIFVSHSIPADRYRWTIVHELAHLIFHHHIPLLGSKRDIDSEADRFTSEFLMPRSDIRKQLVPPVTLEKLARMKPYWKVSIASLIMTASSLGKISDSTKSRLFSRMNVMGIARNEPYAIRQEVPQMVRKLIQFHLSELHYSAEEVEDLAGITIDDMRYYFPDSFDGAHLRVVK
jgi:Zn-dependent peptidase ImmA (M78 family)/DNA-binding XRE family transcriptional regulator